MRPEVANLQPRSEKGQNNGYAPLNSSGQVPPANLFPSFSGAAEGTIWTKSGSSLTPLSGVAFSGDGLTTNNIMVGQITSGVYGVKVSSGSTPLFLRGGTGNRVMIDYNQTVGGANISRSGFLWFIDPSGGFSLGAGTFTGDVAMDSNDITGLVTTAGSALVINYVTPTLTSSSGNITMVAPAGGGVVVPSTASSSNSTFALNHTSASALYGRLGSTNTWTQINTFSSAPVVPDGSFSIAKTTSLQAGLDAALKRNGSNVATADISLGGFKLVNVATPTLTGDAVNLGYLQANYDTDTVTGVSAAAGTPISLSAPDGDVIFTIPKATSTVDGYLDSDDWVTFNSKQAPVSATAPVAVASNVISMTQASGSTNGWLASSDYARFNNPTGIAGARPSALLASKTSASDVTTTTQTSIHSYTVPAAGLAAGDVITFRTAGKFILEGAETISVVFAQAGATVFTISLPGGGFTPSTSEVPYELVVTMAVRTAGASGTASCSAILQMPHLRSFSGPSSVSVDTTAAMLLNLLVTFSAVTGTDHMSAEIGTVRIN